MHLHCSCDEDSEPDMPSAARRIAQIMATGTYMWQQRRRRLLDGPFFLFKIVWWQLAMACPFCSSQVLAMDRDYNGGL